MRYQIQKTDRLDLDTYTVIDTYTGREVMFPQRIEYAIRSRDNFNQEERDHLSRS